jgi:glutamate carboxypeptidase
MTVAAAATWLEEQLPAMEAALEALVLENSHTGNPAGGRKVGRLLLDVFGMPGLVPEVVKSERFADHLVFRSFGDQNKKPLALVGHLDTVFPPGHFEGYQVDGIYRRGPGVLDMKGGLVVMAWALKAVAVTRGLDGVPPLRLCIVGDEEVGSLEGAPLIRRVIDGCAACLVFESGRANDAIVTRRRGTGNCVCHVHGKAAHSGNDYWAGANAVWAASRLVDQVQALSDKATGTTVNAGLFTGGTSRNTVPAEARVELDLRYETAKAGEELWKGLHAAAEKAAQSVPGTRIELEKVGGRGPMERLPGAEELLTRYNACAVKYGLKGGEAPVQGGASDGNTAAAMGIPVIDGLGPRGTGYHTKDEYIEVGTLVSKAAALAEFLLGA